MEPGANDMFMIVSDTECEGHTKQKVRYRILLRRQSNKNMV